MPFLLRCQGGEAFYLAVTQILILLIVRAQQRRDAVFTAVGAAITLRRGKMLLKFSPLVYALRCRSTAVRAAITLRRGQMLLKFSPLV